MAATLPGRHGLSGGGRRPIVTFTKLPASQWKSAHTNNAIERLHEEFKCRIKTQTVRLSAETAAIMFWARIASGQISMREVDGWKTLAVKPATFTCQEDAVSSARPHATDTICFVAI
jgi:hypothetical protein